MPVFDALTLAIVAVLLTGAAAFLMTAAGMQNAGSVNPNRNRNLPPR